MRTTLADILVRNVSLLVLLSAGIVIMRSWSAESIRPIRTKTGVARVPGRGYSLVEVLVAIAIIGVLAALSIPALQRMRATSQQSVVLTHLRDNATVLNAYLADSKSVFPYCTDPTADRSYIESIARGPHLWITYFGLYDTWNVALADGYYDGNPVGEQFFHPAFDRSVESPSNHTTYYYGCCFLAAPEYWRPETRTGPAQWRATSSHEVELPAAKSLLFCGWRPQGDLSRIHTMAMVDTSTRAVDIGRINVGYRNGDGPGHVLFHDTSSPQTMHTIGGVRGRDLP